MHPELLRELINQRASESRAIAHEARLARSIRKLRRAQRDLTDVADTLGIPAIPDYVDTMFGEKQHAA